MRCSLIHIKFQVPATFVDSYDLPEVMAPPQDEVQLRTGWPVLVSRGKHSGKTGKVTLVEHHFIRVIEDVTNMEVSYPLYFI